MKVFFAPRTVAALLVLAVLSISGSVVTWATLSAASDTSWHERSPVTQRKTAPITADHPPVKFEPAFAARVANVEQYLLERPGTVSIVIHDRFTGARWGIGEVDDFMPTMSTVKLAIAVDLLTREEAGELTLSKTDYANLHLMLHESDNDAADALWNKYGAKEMLKNFPNYGFTAEFDSATATNWIDLTSSAHALDDLMNYVLTGMSAPLREYLVQETRTVAPNQQWGV
ncbi:MAG: hypothetical protein HOQ05_07840, partial [Corynebacteriales bacterium]|nr:hypothetical protein [Mycobacteriales bacterium]